MWALSWMSAALRRGNLQGMRWIEFHHFRALSSDEMKPEASYENFMYQTVKPVVPLRQMEE